jgi:FAD-dependent sensor of blue light
MHQIVYTSSAKQEFSAADLKKLLIAARMRNKAVGVTGMLVFHDGAFLQALEGEKRAVNEIFARIQNDPRHGDLVVLHRGPGPEQRVFGEWSMGFADFSGAAAILKGFVRFNEDVKLTDLDSARAVELLTACDDDERLKSA